MTRERIKPAPGQSHQAKEMAHRERILAPFDNALADSKSFAFNPIPVNSPAGILCTVSGATATIFRADHAGGGYDCYVSLIGSIDGGKGYTSASWVGDKPPGGLSLTVILNTKNGGFVGTVDVARQDVGCGDRGRVMTYRQDIDPDLYPLTESMWILVNQSSWYQC